MYMYGMRSSGTAPVVISGVISVAIFVDNFQISRQKLVSHRGRRGQMSMSESSPATTNPALTCAKSAVGSRQSAADA